LLVVFGQSDDLWRTANCSAVALSYTYQEQYLQIQSEKD
jgi:hypothetical protein